MPNASDSDLYDPLDGKPEMNAPEFRPLVVQVVAMTEDGMIGKNNDLPWGHWKEDLQFFKKTTMDAAVVMGMNTILSIPKKLPGRLVYGLSSEHRRGRPANFYDVADIMLVNVRGWINDVDLSNVERKDVIFIAGGGKLYRETMATTDVIYQNIIIPNDPINVEQEDTIVYYPIHQLEKYFMCVSTQEELTPKGKMVKKIWVKRPHK